MNKGSHVNTWLALYTVRDFVFSFVEEATKVISLKLAEISEPKFYHQFGKASVQ